MALFHRRQASQPIEPAPIPVPRPSIDGWTLADTSLVAKLSKPDLRELEILLHGIAVAAETPYTYERAAILLERAGEPGPAMSVCDAWLAQPAAKWPEYIHHSRAIDKRRSRLRTRAPTAEAS
jgi:hypothetical protein